MPKKELMPFIAADAELPAHLQNSKGLGNEEVSQEDMSLPRLNVLQQLSPQVDEDKAEYVEGAKAGLLHNSVTNELFESVYLINLYYNKNFAVFNKRTTGVKAFHGTFNEKEEALAYLRENNVAVDTVDIVETGNHYCLLLDEQGKPKSPVLFALSSTKLKFSDKWNTELRMTNLDRFATVWEVSTVKQSNNKGSWYNVSINNVGRVNEELYESAKDAYTSVTSALGFTQEKAA